MKIEHSEIPWRAIVGTRNHLVHGYDDVDYDTLWNIATVDFPPLAMQLRTLLQTRGWAESIADRHPPPGLFTREAVGAGRLDRTSATSSGGTCKKERA